MEYLWPLSFYLLLLIPLLIFAYILRLRRRKPNAIRFSSLSLIKDALPKQPQWRRHLPFALFLLALVSLITALARPQDTVTLPVNNATIILAIDVSRSMCSIDISPNRLEAAKQAALEFVNQQNEDTQIGVVAFAGYAVLVQPPTSDRDLLTSAIQNLTTARRTAIGEGILMSLDAISEIDDSVLSPFSGVESDPVPEGYYTPSIIVLLTDGVSTSGTLPLDAAQYAANQGVRVYTIGFGTNHNNSPMICGLTSQDVTQFNSPLFGGGGGGAFRREIDEDTLKQISELTGSSYRLAESASELQEVFDDLSTQLFTVTETVELNAIFAALAAVLLTLAILFSIVWNPLL